MAGGLRDVLALQGVTPVSKPGTAASPPGGTVGLFTGTWVDGRPDATVANPGAVSWMQLNGVWITGSPSVVVDEVETKTRPYDPIAPNFYIEQAQREDEELLVMMRAFIEILRCH